VPVAGPYGPVYPTWGKFAERLGDLARETWRSYPAAVVVALALAVVAALALGRLVRGLRRTRPRTDEEGPHEEK
jgi:hypothetical protein